MTLGEIKNGESKNIEFKIQLPDDSKKYMKTIVAYANTSGGKLIIGVDDITKKILLAWNQVLSFRLWTRLPMLFPICVCRRSFRI